VRLESMKSANYTPKIKREKEKNDDWQNFD